MARKPPKVRNQEQADALRMALARGSFDLANASRVLRALGGQSQDGFAAQLGLSVKVIKSIESGRGNPNLDSLRKIAAAFGLHVAFVKPPVSAELMDPADRAEDERRRRDADAEELHAGRISARELHERNAMQVDDIDFELPELS